MALWWVVNLDDSFHILAKSPGTLGRITGFGGLFFGLILEGGPLFLGLNLG